MHGAGLVGARAWARRYTRQDTTFESKSMHHILSLPDLQSFTGSQWPAVPSKALQHALSALTFEPAQMELWFLTTLYPMAEFLRLKVPVQHEEGTVETEAGAKFEYIWGSIDGRSTDWLRLHAPYDAAQLTAFVAQIEALGIVQRYQDMNVILKSASFDTSAV